MAESLKARFIIEIMGRPPEHISGALAGLVDKVGSEKGVKIIDKKLHEPKPIEEAKNLFITFAEVDAEFENLDGLLTVLFSYMPSNIEIYSPEKMKIGVDTFNAIINSITTRLHHYDALAKRLISERDILANQLNQITSGKTGIAEKKKESSKDRNKNDTKTKEKKSAKTKKKSSKKN